MSTTIHRCGCGHNHLEHAKSGGSCSFGYCRCQNSHDFVKANGTAEVIPTWPGYDHATGKWAVR